MIDTADDKSGVWLSLQTIPHVKAQDSDIGGTPLAALSPAGFLGNMGTTVNAQMWGRDSVMTWQVPRDGISLGDRAVVALFAQLSDAMEGDACTPRVSDCQG